jgi:hypothetical protein
VPGGQAEAVDLSNFEGDGTYPEGVSGHEAGSPATHSMDEAVARKIAASIINTARIERNYPQTAADREAVIDDIMTGTSITREQAEATFESKAKAATDVTYVSFSIPELPDGYAVQVDAGGGLCGIGNLDYHFTTGNYRIAAFSSSDDLKTAKASFGVRIYYAEIVGSYGQSWDGGWYEVIADNGSKSVSFMEGEGLRGSLPGCDPSHLLDNFSWNPDVST